VNYSLSFSHPSANLYSPLRARTRTGLGEKLLRVIIEDMKQLFVKSNHVLRKVLVTTGDDNEPAKRLYEKVGFEKIAVLADLFAKGENEIVYVLTNST